MKIKIKAIDAECGVYEVDGTQYVAHENSYSHRWKVVSKPPLTTVADAVYNGKGTVIASSVDATSARQAISIALAAAKTPG